MNEIKEALKKLEKIRLDDVGKILSAYTTTVYCNNCGDRVGRVKPGSGRVDILCSACGSASDAYARAQAHERAKAEKK